MVTTLENIPVAEYDDDTRHVEIHRAFQVPLKAAADQGDQKAAQQVVVLESHIREHLDTAEREAATVSSMAPPTPSPTDIQPPAGPPGAVPPQSLEQALGTPPPSL
jgi:hypothetical protein